MVLNCQAKITHFVNRSYCNYFGIKWGDQDKPFAPHVCSKICGGMVKGRLCYLTMVWREGKYHIMDWYFCMIDVKGINRKNTHHVQYHDVLSAIRPIPHSPDFPVPEPDGNVEHSSDSEHGGDQPIVLDTSRIQWHDTRPEPQSAQLLGTHHKEKHLLALGTMFYWYQDREREREREREHKTVFHIPRQVISLLQQHCWSVQINGFRVWCRLY